MSLEVLIDIGSLATTHLYSITPKMAFQLPDLCPPEAMMSNVNTREQIGFLVTTSHLPITWRYTFTSEADVLHEAFFDPVDINEAVGADADNGALKPNIFNNGTDEVVIKRVDWQDDHCNPATT